MTTQREARSTDGRGGRGARQRILNTATDLFYREGINATGVERLASEASVSKRTLYQHFPSKAAVVEEYLRCIQQGVGDPIRPGLDAANRTPRERILALFETPVTGRGRCAAVPSTMPPWRRRRPCRKFTTSSTNTSAPTSRA